MAAQTARLIAGWLPGVPVAGSAVAGDYIAADLDPGGLPPSHARLVSSYTTAEHNETTAEHNEGAAWARAAIERFAGPPGESPAGDVHELIVTHNCPPAGTAALDRVPGPAAAPVRLVTFP